MRKFYLTKIFPYDPTYGGKHTKYKGYALITKQKLSPGISSTMKLLLPSKINVPVYCSTLNRARQTATIISKSQKVNKIQKLPELNEILFSLESLLTGRDYEKYGSDLVRQRFIDAFIKDELMESRSSVKARMERLLSKLEKLPNGNYLLISHSFFMKLLQIFLKHNDLFDNPKLLRDNFDYRKKTFNFGEGFNFTLK
jgi:broad specificity phosphatase PhoE